MVNIRQGVVLVKHTGDKVNVILSRWELEKSEFKNKSAANRIMKFNAAQFLRRKYGVEGLRQVKVVEVS